MNTNPNNSLEKRRKNNKKIYIGIGILLLIGFIGSRLENDGGSDNKSSEQSSQNAQIKESGYISGIMAAAIYEPLKSKGFKIDKQFEADAFFVNCDKVSANFQEHCRLAGKGPSELVEIRASYTSFSNLDVNTEAIPFLSFIATLPYTNSQPDKAKQWVRENISKNSKTEIGGVVFEIFSNTNNIRTLNITPKNPSEL